MPEAENVQTSSASLVLDYNSIKEMHPDDICEDFASEALEFIPAIDVVDSEKKDNAVSTYEHFIYVCAEHGLSEQEVRGFLEYQVLTDFVLTNTDRHLNNFGILRDSRTLKFVRMAPIFDSGNSMFWDSPRLPERSNCTEITVNSFRKTETELLKLVTDRSCVRMDLLPCRDEIAELYAKDDSIAFVDSILIGYEKKKALLEQFMEKGTPAQNRHKRITEPER